MFKLFLHEVIIDSHAVIGNNRDPVYPVTLSFLHTAVKYQTLDTENAIAKIKLFHHH